jgi:glycosyltransferase involved in cell wall biosynthesis
MRKVYLVYYDFKGTSGNHAGMSYLVKMLGRDIKIVEPIKSLPHHYPGGKYLAKIYAVGLAVYFRFALGKQDKVFFFEYLTKGTAYQVLTARVMRALGINQPIYGLIHLSGQHMLDLYRSQHYIRQSLKPLDKVFVLGSSLAEFLRNIGFEKEIVTTFHYVDTAYYRPAPSYNANDLLQVICIGSLKRNFSLLQSVVSKLPDVLFHVMMGRNNLRPYFENVNNVQLYPFIPEDEMLQLMQRCDVSMSVMEDTVGSNVITTSMATGLVLAVSDVGSIRDYCSEGNSFLCSTEQDFVEAIKALDKDRTLLLQMRQATLQRASELSHSNFITQFKSMI